MKYVIAISALLVIAACSSSNNAQRPTPTVPRATTSSPAAPTVPGAPRPVSAVPNGSGIAKLIWNPPADDGGSPITGYSVTPYLGSRAQPGRTFNSRATAENITGLQNGKVYVFEIAARNAVGTGAYSPNSSPMTVGAPGQPGKVAAVKSASGTLKITFAAPANNGATITSYTVVCTSTNGGEAKTKTGDKSPTSVAGLSVGRSYSCTVKASNSRGTGPPSEPSNKATA